MRLNVCTSGKANKEKMDNYDAFDEVLHREVLTAVKGLAVRYD